ncbi:hypothetical protein QQF64_008539 [Cirrhinus molitorella]|uniref:Uncharacterized protein n=1 Tax=Cirrhinus molitorella TaxID=172907 RepID=A0ABR3M9W9_9TELE
MSAQKQGSMSVKRFKSLIIEERANEHSQMPPSGSGELKKPFVCHSSFPLAAISKERCRELQTSMCSGPSPFSDLLWIRASRLTYAVHRPSWLTKGTRKRDTRYR